MNLKLLFVTILISLTIFDAGAAQLGASAIKRRQYVACGINSEYASLAYTDNKIWKGIDADLCRAAATAFLGNSERFKLIPVNHEEIGKALNSGKIDLMLGHTSLSSSEETKLSAAPVDIIFFTRQIFASRKVTEASSMRDFSEAKVCVLGNSHYATALAEYNEKYALRFNIIELPSLASVKENFYLNRCDLATGDEIFIKEIVNNLNSKEPADILPEEIALMPVKAYVSAKAPHLSIALRWILNGLKLASASNITNQNINTFNATKNHSLQNLLGLRPNAWTALHLYPDWVKSYISQYGNYQQILERNMGNTSPLQIDLKLNETIEKGGFIYSQPFI